MLEKSLKYIEIFNNFKNTIKSSNSSFFYCDFWSQTTLFCFAMKPTSTYEWIYRLVVCQFWTFEATLAEKYTKVIFHVMTRLKSKTTIRYFKLVGFVTVSSFVYWLFIEIKLLTIFYDFLFHNHYILHVCMMNFIFTIHLWSSHVYWNLYKLKTKLFNWIKIMCFFFDNVLTNEWRNDRNTAV